MTTTMTCEHCGQTAELISKEGRVKRGDRTVGYPAMFWSCPGCHDPETGESPFVFSDNELLQRNSEAAQAAWQRRYGERIPVRRAAGRPVADEHRRGETIAIRFTEEELKLLDEKRGEASRSDFVRDAVRVAARG